MAAPELECELGAGTVTPREAIEAAGLAEAETAYRFQLARESFEAGYAAAGADMARRWDRIARATHGPAHAGLELKRWGPGGREHFADPRPGDYPGRVRPEPAPEPEPEPEPEVEASA